MKKRYLFVILIILLVLTLALSACNDEQNPAENDDGQNPSGQDPVEYSVTFNLNYAGAAVTVLKTQNGVVQFAEEPQRDNYKFLGWYLDAEGITPFTAQSVTADTVLYAKWQKLEDEEPPQKEHSITFSLNGGDGVLPQSTTVVAGSNYTLPLGDKISRDGYIFDGWKSGDKVYAAGDVVKVESDMEFAAIWAAATTVKFDLNGGSGTAPQDIIVKSGTGVTLPDGANISKDVYVFDGWLDKSDNLIENPYIVT